MAKIERYQGNLEAFASDAETGERTIFDSETTSDNLTDNINASFKRGWGVVGVNENPTKQDFNAMAYVNSQLAAYLHQMGVAEWNKDQEYHDGSFVNRNGVLYVCKTDDHVSVTPPENDATNWKQPENAVQSISDLRDITGAYDGQSLQVAGYYTPGDGGGGPLRVWKTGAVGEYVDNGGSIIVPTGGDGSGAWVWEHSGDINAKWFGAGMGSDDSATLTAASLYCKSIGKALNGHANTFIVDGSWTISHDLIGGIYQLNDNAVVTVETTDVDDHFTIGGRWFNISSDPILKGITITSDDAVTKKGTVVVNIIMFDFLVGIWAQYLNKFIVESGSYFKSTNLVLTRFSEAHVTVSHTDLYICKGAYSDGGVLGFLSGAGVVEEHYEGTIADNATDHGFYSSSPTDKVLTVFDNVRSLNPLGTGVKCFSNGDLFVKNPYVKNAGAIGIIAVADNSYVLGGMVDGATEAAVYQLGKAVGAGVNEFSSLVVKGLTTRNCASDGIRVSGPDILTKVVVEGCDIECARRPVYIASTVDVDTLEVLNNDKLLSFSATEQSIYNEATIDVVTVVKNNIGTTTSSANLIDVHASTLRLEDNRFFGTAIARLLRNRGTTTENFIRGNIVSVPSSNADVYRVDSGTVIPYVDVVAATGTIQTVSWDTGAPVAGTWAKGDIVYNSSPDAGGFVGWVCTVAGTPGVWKTFGEISA